MARQRVLVVGLGNMGMSHAPAYARIAGFELVGVCERRVATRKLPDALAGAARFEEALARLEPDSVSVNTLPDTHADFAIKAMEAGAHVFVEKPLADSVPNAEKVVATAKRTGRKLVIGYILQHHPSWTRFIEIARELGRLGRLVRSRLGPMISETAFFVKDVFGPKGSVSIVMGEHAAAQRADDINTHTKTNQILRRHADMSRPDERIDLSDKPDHDALCEREQRFFLRAIEEDLDLGASMEDAVKSVRIVLAADESIHSGQVMTL